MEKFFGAVGWASWCLAAITKLILAAIVIEVVADVALRNLNLRPIGWGISAIEYGLLYAAFLPMPWLVHIKGHVFVEFLRKALPEGGRRVLERVVYLVCVGLCVYVTWVSAGMTWEAWQTGSYETKTFDMPNWAIYAPVCLGFLLSTLEWLRFLVGQASLYDLGVLEREGL
ncbi:TRAP transporter small permease [Acidimangrovimonas sediminis]|uniref:TRAP transporter small permease n=1 Tax=Acidimangrovimonas sediminis TaxID=2056283 RepID=UPI000C809328|nr:TRAP transporter small permease [Acidimangrovimonas sediminis]